MKPRYYATEHFDNPIFASRKIIDEIEMMLTTYDSILPGSTATYGSSEITTGRRMYFDFLLPQGVRSKTELQQKLNHDEFDNAYNELLNENMRLSAEFSSNLRARGHAYVIDPAKLHAPGFHQEHYYHLWERVFIKKIREVHFNTGWEYSNGCSREYLIASRLGIKRYDKNGYDIHCKKAISMMTSAINELDEYGFDTEFLVQNLNYLKSI